jgi:ElaB/YqjD/DUF883 family membrane-anchored ribosome-binding protein
MKEPTEPSPQAARERLEQQADRARSRLFHELDELKARGQSVADRVEGLKSTVRRHPGVLVGVAAGTVIALGVVLFARRARRRKELRRDAILGVAARLLGPAYVVEPVDQRHGVVRDSVKKAGSVLVAAVGRELGRRALLALSSPEVHPSDGRAPA